MTIAHGIRRAVSKCGFRGWRDQAPGKTPLPYVTFDSPSAGEPDGDTGTAIAENVVVRLHAWANEDAQVDRMLDALEAEFLGNGIAASGGAVLEVNRGSREDAYLDPDRDEQGEEVWHGVIDFTILTDREPGA